MKPEGMHLVSRPIRVFLVDDHEVVRRGVAELLEANDDIEVVGEASTVMQARNRIPVMTPDVAIIDLRLPDGSGLDVVQDLRDAGSAVRTLVLTAFDDEQSVFAAITAGASAYVVKSIGGMKLVSSVREVAAGHNLIDPVLRARAVRGIVVPQEPEPDPRLALLSLREREVLSYLAEGMTNREIAHQLGLAEKTVKNYVSTLLGKLALRRRTQAIALEVENRMLYSN
jgi:DNA-binding NarL/FixJ family response regulator